MIKRDNIKHIINREYIVALGERSKITHLIRLNEADNEELHAQQTCNAKIIKEYQGFLGVSEDKKDV